MRDSIPQGTGPDRSLASLVAQRLADRIVIGALRPGQPIRQDHIAAEFGASHVPVREAFRKLEAQGLLVSEPRRGVRVAPINPAAVFEVTQMRAALEVLALRHAAPKLSPKDLDAARAALADGEGGSQLSVWEEANRRFHRAITAPCGMPRLMSAIDDLHRVSARFLLAIWTDLSWQPRSNAEHRVIIARLEQADARSAATALRHHILGAGQALLAQLSDRAAP